MRPSGHDFYSLETTPTDFYTSKRKRNCRLRCQGKCKRVRWSGCVSFSSTIPNEYGNECNCYGWKSLPDFGPAAESTVKATPTYPDIASLSFSKAGWFLSSPVFPSFWCPVIPANNTDYSFDAVTALKRVLPCNVCVLRIPKQFLSFFSFEWILISFIWETNWWSHFAE